MPSFEEFGLVFVLCAVIVNGQVDIDYNCPEPECKCATLDKIHLLDKVQVYCEVPYFHHSLKFTAIQSTFTTRLTLVCGTDFLTGHIVDGAFQHLSELEELAIYSCKIKSLRAQTFKGLSSLKQLNITSPNAIDFHQNLFHFTPNLELVNFGNSHIHSLPTEMFCQLEKLRVVEMPNNNMGSMFDIGLTRNDGTTCYFPELIWLNLMFNNIQRVTLPMAELAPNLKALFFYSNKISKITATSFQNLTELVYLDLSHNRLTEIDPSLMLGLHSLKILFISNNRIQCLDEELFHNCPMLDIFSAKNNNLKQECLHVRIFERTRMLRAIDLSSNHIQSVNAALFSNLTQLHELCLELNDISHIEPNSFENLPQLARLNISHNRLEEFLNKNTNPDTYLPGLQILDLSFNHLTDATNMNIDAFPNIMGFALRSNNFSAFPTAFRTLQKLQELDLSYNNISEINPTLFVGLNNMNGFFFEGNRITYIPSGCFAEMRNLETIDLSYNDIDTIHLEAFRPSDKLHTIYLQHNYLRDIAVIFAGNARLRKITLKGNYIKRIRRGDFGNAIEDLDISYNRISYIEGYAFSSMDALKTVRINGNYLTGIRSIVFRVSPQLTRKPDFYISNNPYHCDCGMQYLRTINDGVPLGASTQINGFVADLRSVLCKSLADPRARIFQFLVDIETLYCSYDIDCKGSTLSCPCCYNTDVDCACREVCPHKCVCLHSDDKNDNKVLCSNNHFTAVPAIPSQATVIDLDGGNFTRLTKTSFKKNTAVENLYLNNGVLEVIETGAFNELSSLRELDLSNNSLMSLPRGTFQGLRKLTNLNLKQNVLVSFAGEHMKFMPNLVALDISGNNLKTLDTDNFAITKLHTLYLSNNNWTCDCEFGAKFQRWLTANVHVIPDESEMTCGYVDDRVEFNGTTSLLGASFDMCRPAHLRTVVKMSKTLLGITIAMTVVFILLVVLVICIYTKRNLIQIWLYSRFGVRIYRQKEDLSRRFDAFISYSNEDQDVVVHELLPQLEEGNPPYTLCVHFRDWLIGGGIAESVIDSVNASRRTILLLSKNFIESGWCNYEFKTAHHRVLKDKSCHLIVILLEDEPPEGLDKELQLYITTHTYIRYSDPWFWKRLRFALPDVSERQKSERIANKEIEKKMISEQREFLEGRRRARDMEEGSELSIV